MVEFGPEDRMLQAYDTYYRALNQLCFDILLALQFLQTHKLEPLEAQVHTLLLSNPSINVNASGPHQVRSTIGFLDPEYFQSSQFTEESDVYNFGIILIELLTSQKPRCLVQSIEKRSLVTYILLSMEENHFFEILDPLVIKEGAKKEIVATTKLAQRCLNLNGRKRPTMKIVAMELEGIRGGASYIVEQDHKEVYFPVVDNIEWCDAASTPTNLYEQPFYCNNTF